MTNIEGLPPGFDIIKRPEGFRIAEVLGAGPQVEADDIFDRQILPRGPFSTLGEARQDLDVLLGERQPVDIGGLAER